ncbi:LOW QUALITY PROTEIN: uncharacterized protein ACR2FA_000264 [Aphomia sociella]
MLISRVSEDGRTSEDRKIYEGDNDLHEYQTASELFDLMSRNQTFVSNENEALTTSEIVILYKNIDIGTKLMNNANELKRPNQHVESVVYNEEPDSDSSDLSEICSNEDLNNLFLINKQRIDLLNNPPSLENTLCQKLGNLEIQSSHLKTEYDKNFLFKDPHIKEQFKKLNVLSSYKEFGTVLPASLLDYICCKRLEDDYNFYMDNIISHVKHTIDQLKRISNGDYLTDKAKQKWREVKSNSTDTLENKKVLAMSTSIPLHVERKFNGCMSTWDDIVHSEVDIRSLSKILEKIVVEIPRMISGTYTLFSKCCVDNLIISCKKDKQSMKTDTEESRVDVVLQLKRSDSGHVVSNINSIMILQAAPVPLNEFTISEALTFPSTKDNKKIKEKNVNSNEEIKIVELNEDDVENNKIMEDFKENKFLKSFVNSEENINCDSVVNSNYNTNSEIVYNISLKAGSNQETSESSISLKDILDVKAANFNINKEASYDIIPPDELRLTMQRLSIQSSLAEESGDDTHNQPNKKKSSTRVRIKSPYENQSFLLEEKKRKKLLEIRERRERKKIALSESCRITKHKYGKSVNMAQSSSSVTKLSITNKSFYNSIYGNTINVDNKMKPVKKELEGRKGKKKTGFEIPMNELEDEHIIQTPDTNSKKYINRSYYLDDAMTEMMYMQMKRQDGLKEICSTSTSAASTDFSTNLSLLSQLIAPSAEFGSKEDSSNISVYHLKTERLDGIKQTADVKDHSKVYSSRSILNIVPANSPKGMELEGKGDPLKITTSLECRKSIEKIYNLMNKLEKTDAVESNTLKCKLINTSNDADKNLVITRGSSFAQGSDSGTSVNHHLTSSNASCFSFNKSNNAHISNIKQLNNKKTETATAVVPKVIISTKSQTLKYESDKNRKDKKRVSVGLSKIIPDNPLKAISQLLHKFDNVQKTRQKIPEPKQDKKADTDNRIISRQGSFKRRSRLDQQLRDNEQVPKNITVFVPKERKPIPPIELSRIPQQQIPVHEKGIEKSAKKKICDIIDEAKEARGEAVRGPSKLTSRLNTLAQPKRSYVQAHSEEYQTKYGKSVVADRLQKLAMTPVSTDRTIGVVSMRSKQKRTGPDGVLSASMKLPPASMPPLERTARLRRSSSTSPEAKIIQPQADIIHKPSLVADSPESLKDKMVAVESYVKNHYGRVPLVAPASEFLMARKSKTNGSPLTPEASVRSSLHVRESTEIRSKLHNIIHTMINSNAPGLTPLSECNETNNSRMSKDTDEMFLNNSYSKDEEPISLDSDYRVDVFEDTNVLTAVENVINGDGGESIAINCNDDNNEIKYDVQTFNSYSELEQLESALHRRLSLGTFNKRLRLKKLTLTPKQSLNQLVVLQSGDSSSLIVKTSLLQNIRKSNSSTQNISDIKSMSMLTSSYLDWNYTNIPIQITTVGYAFPKYQSNQYDSNYLRKSLINISKNENESSLSTRSHKTRNCFKSQDNLKTKQAVQAQANEFPITSSLHSLLATASEKKKNKLDETEDIDYTTSLDILVGLLNEIQKITCQAQLTVDGNDLQSNQLQNIFTNAAALENVMKDQSCHLVSMTSLEKLKQLESSPSIYSFYLTNHDIYDLKEKQNDATEMRMSTKSMLCNNMPVYADKEVSVDIIEKEYVNTFTDVPSNIFPVSINHSTNGTNSLIGILSKPSSQSMFSLNDCQVQSDNCSFNSQKEIQLSSILGHSHLSKKSLDSYHNIIEVTNKKEKRETMKDVKEVVHTNQNVSIQRTFKAYNSSSDPLINVKRDILVTLYSMLVLTVFAALSFPEIMYHA